MFTASNDFIIVLSTIVSFFESLPYRQTRIVLYLVWVASDDVDTQTHGVVSIYFERNDWRTATPDRFLNMPRLVDCFPVRISAVHLCLQGNHPILTLSMAALLMQVGKALRVRSRVHDGSITEINYKLMTFSIPVDALPIRSSGEIKTKNHIQWIESRIALDLAMQQARQNKTPMGEDAVECPRLPDVVFKVGERGTRPGNVKLRELVEARHGRYQTKASRSVKNEVIKEIVQGIEAVGGRFLVWDSRGWYVVLKDPSIIKKHISTYIRDYKNRRSSKRSRTEQQQQQRQQQKQSIELESSTITFLSNDSNNSSMNGVGKGGCGGDRKLWSRCP
jgi:hypothetical protein